MKRVHIDDDDFVWHVLTETEACYYIDCGIPVHAIDEQGDREIKSKREVQHVIRRGLMVATPVGFTDDKCN